MSLDIDLSWEACVWSHFVEDGQDVILWGFDMKISMDVLYRL